MIVVSLPVFLPAVVKAATKPKKRKLLALPLPTPDDGSDAVIPVIGDSEAVVSEATENGQDSVSERTHYFTTAKNLLLTGSNAVERLMSSYKGKSLFCLFIKPYIFQFFRLFATQN